MMMMVWWVWAVGAVVVDVIHVVVGVIHVVVDVIHIVVGVIHGGCQLRVGASAGLHPMHVCMQMHTPHTHAQGEVAG